MNSIEYDMFGPEKIIEVYNAKIGMHGFVVIDNTALGVGKGGIRMTQTVNKQEVAKLARAMTLKNALADLPFGGAKSGIIANANELNLIEKKEMVKAFANALKIVVPSQYVAAPDMNMAAEEMKWFAEEIGSKKACTGKPFSMGGLPHELGSTGYGVAIATEEAVKFIKKDLRKMTFAVEGFGNVGTFATKFLIEKGAKLIAVSDSKGCVFEKEGIDFEELLKIKNKTGSVINYSSKKPLFCPGIISAKVDILITAAIPDLIKINDISKVNAKIIIEGSNIPMSDEVEEILYERGVLIIPDIIANAGGVISSYIEYTGGNEELMFKTIKEKIRKNTNLILKESKKNKISPREAAIKIAKKRILAKCNVCKN